MEPTIYGMELDPGMEIEDNIPDCCGGEMEQSKKNPCTCCKSKNTHVEYTCRACGTVVEVDGLGLVFDIREKQTA